jgi:hypothetical protein
LRKTETSLEQYDLAIANDLLKEANSTLGPLWYAVAGPVPIEVKTAAEITACLANSPERVNK